MRAAPGPVQGAEPGHERRAHVVFVAPIMPMGQKQPRSDAVPSVDCMPVGHGLGGAVPPVQ